MQFAQGNGSIGYPDALVGHESGEAGLGPVGALPGNITSKVYFDKLSFINDCNRRFLWKCVLRPSDNRSNTPN